MRVYPYTDSEGRTVWACCESAIGPVCEHLRKPPVDAELFARTAPRWNCVDFRDGMHQLGGETCRWCGKGREVISAELSALGDEWCADHV